MVEVEAVSAAGLAVGFWQGAMAGALLIGAALLAGFTVLGRSPSAFCGLLMTASAAVLSLMWLGLVPTPSAEIVYLIAGSFAAATVLFVSSTVSSARNNALLGGLLFAGALSIVGIAVINLVLGGEAAGLLRLALVGGGAAVIVLSAIEAWRGDAGARLILPGALIAAIGPVAAAQLGAGPAAAATLFAIGVLGASVMAGAEAAFRRAQPSPAFHLPESAGYSSATKSTSKQELLRVSENQLAQVLDYAGVAVWDWSEGAAHQTKSFATMMGADGGAFTPEDFSAFVDESSRALFESDVIGLARGDGGFDAEVSLVDGRRVRLRGARAIKANGELERIVVFLEEARSAVDGDPLRTAAASLTAAAAAAGLRRRSAAPPADEFVAALEAGDVSASFQPIVSLENNAVVGYEALLRWRRGETDVPPADILASAAMAGRSADISRLVVRAAAEKVSGARKNTKQPLFAAFNTSVSQLVEPGFIEEVRAAIRDFSLPRHALVLELTEAERIREIERIGDVFASLRSAGLKLAIDDFGAGFSCLQNLSSFEFDYLKIDRSFVDRMADETGAAKIVAGLARLGKDLGMTVIAEGVETRKIADAARKAGCVLGQGYLFGEPAGAAAGRNRPAALDDIAEEPTTPETQAKAKGETETETLVKETFADEVANDAGADTAPVDIETLELTAEEKVPASKPIVRRRRFWGGDLR